MCAQRVRTGDGALIHYTAGGVISDSRGRARATGRPASGCRSRRPTCGRRPRFETADERYAWLSGIVVVGHNELSTDHIDYRMYRVL